MLAVLVIVAGVAWIAIRDARRGYSSTRGAAIERFTLHSRLVGHALHEILLLPNGGSNGRELLVFLHGRGSSPASNLTLPLFDELHSVRARRSSCCRGLRAHDVIAAARTRRLYRVAVWIDVGRDDPFAQADEALARELERTGTRLTFHLHGGGHGGWTGRMPQYLRFYSRACA